MANLEAIFNNPAAVVSIIFFVGYTVGLWGIPALRSLLKQPETN